MPGALESHSKPGINDGPFPPKTERRSQVWLKSATKTYELNSVQIQRERQDLEKLAKPQEGVDALKDKFKGPVKPIPRLVDKNAAKRQR
jgi:hypothetical protein